MIPTYAKWFVLGAIIIILAYEGWALFDHKPNDTISATMWNFAQRGAWKVVIPVLWGILTAHFFVNRDNLIPLVVGLSIGAIWMRREGSTHL